MDPRDTPPEHETAEFQPFDETHELFIIGWCLRTPAAIAFAQSEMGPNDFYFPLFSRIFERMGAKVAADRPVTPATIWASMKTDADLISAGGIDILEQWARTVPYHSTLEIERHIRDAARTVVELRVRRDALEALWDGVTDLQAGGAIGPALGAVVAIADRQAERADAEAGSEMVTEVGWAVIRDLENPDPEAHLAAAPTGLITLDDVIGGVVESNLLVAGGRPGMGKSIFGTTAARAMAAAGFAVDYFSLEMTKRELTIRMLCDIDYDRALRDGLQPIHYSRVLKRQQSDAERGRLAEAMIHLAGLPIEIHDRDEMTMAQITGICRAKCAGTPEVPRRVIIDHMHLIEPTDRYRGRKVDEISEITKGAKRLAKRLNVGVVLLAQLNREIERRDEKMPTMADFRDAGSIEQDADVMLGLNRPHYWLQREKGSAKETQEEATRRIVTTAEKVNVLEVGILKNRHGETKDLSLFVDVAASAMRDQMPDSSPTLFTPGERPF